MKKQGGIALLIPLAVVVLAILFGLIMLCDSKTVRAANPSLYEADLSPTTTSTGESCALQPIPFNLSVYFSSTGVNPAVKVQRQYRRDTVPVWRDVKTYTASTETIDDYAPNGGDYYYRIIYSGTTGAAHVRIDQ